MSDDMAALLRRWKVQRGAERLAFGPAYDDGGWLVCEPDGRRIAPDTLLARFKTLEKRAKVTHRGPHALRHTHATLALDSGVRLDVVSKQLGHASVAITADVYEHPDDRALKEARDGWRGSGKRRSVALGRITGE